MRNDFILESYQRAIRGCLCIGLIFITLHLSFYTIFVVAETLSEKGRKTNTYIQTYKKMTNTIHYNIQILTTAYIHTHYGITQISESYSLN